MDRGVEAVKEWIKCEDRLPKDYEYIIMTYNNLVLTGWFLENRFYYFDEFGNSEEQEGITHWMPLPNPPQEDKEPYCNFCGSPDNGKKCARSYICDNPPQE